MHFRKKREISAFLKQPRFKALPLPEPLSATPLDTESTGSDKHLETKEYRYYLGIFLCDVNKYELIETAEVHHKIQNSVIQSSNGHMKCICV